MLKLRCATTALLVGCLGLAASPSRAQVNPRPRVVVTTDPELDDANSLIRYLLYSTDFQTEGLVYASSGFHWKGDGSGKKISVPNREYSRWGLNRCPCASWRWAPGEHHIDVAVDTYAEVYPNLRVHDARYPTPAELKSRIRWGNVEFDGDISKDTPGSDLIRELLLDDEPGPVYLLVWGGASTVARALKSIEERYRSSPGWVALHERISGKAVLSMSGDQDDTYATYIQPNWPKIRTLPAGAGGVALGYGAQGTASVDDSVYYGAAWTRDHITTQGPFGALYRVWGDGKQMVKGDDFDYFGMSGYTAAQLKQMGFVVWTPPRPKGEFLGEGDTFTFLNLLNNGLRGYEEETLGGWAGLRPSGVAPTGAATTVIRSYDDLLRLQEDAAARPPAPSPVPDFTAAAQNDLAARLRWSVVPAFAGANHEPRVAMEGAPRLTARPGDTVQLRATASDPDRNAIAVRWWQWKQAGTYPGAAVLNDSTSPDASVAIPPDAREGQTIQFVVEATDNGSPPLTRYARIVVSIVR